MNYYFLPRILGLKSSVTITNFPCLDKFKSLPDPQRIYVTWSDGVNWQNRFIGEIALNQAIKIHLDDLPEDCPLDKTSFVFFHYKEIPEKTDRLVTSDHMFYMPTWRGNIELYSDYTATSYSGEYQHEMAYYIKKGTLISLSPMFQNGANIHNKLLFVNMTPDPTLEKHEFITVNPKTDDILHRTEVCANTCNVIDFSGVEFPEDVVTLSVSKGMAGVPIYFSHNDTFTQMSFEHTHPPTSFVQYGDAIAIQRNLKQSWLSKYV